VGPNGDLAQAEVIEATIKDMAFTQLLDDYLDDEHQPRWGW
jgi:hypothetical protein